MFGNILKRLRIEKNLSQEELANIVNVSKSTIGMYEQGNRIPKADATLKKLAEYFDVTIDYLMGFSDCRYPVNSSSAKACLASRLKEMRHSRNKSQQELADYIGISKSSINMYERGEREPGIETLETIADYFNVDLDYLIGKTDIPNKMLVCNTNIEPQIIPLISKYNRLNTSGKEKAETYMDDLLENPKYTVSIIDVQNKAETKKSAASIREHLDIAAFGGDGKRATKKKRRTT